MRGNLYDLMSSTTTNAGLKILEQKQDAKCALQEELGWPEEPRRPILCLPMEMTDANGGALLRQLLPGLIALPIAILIRGKGSEEYGALFTKLTKTHDYRIAIIPDDERMCERMYAAADMSLFLSAADDTPELQSALGAGAIPIAPTTQALEDYDPIQERGTAFLYEPASVWHCYASLVRALETYKLPFDWKTIQKHDLMLVNASPA